MSKSKGDAATPHQFTDKYQFEADFRGETLYYLEGGRKASMDWTWTNGYKIYPASMGYWTNADGTQTPVSDAERDTIVQRAVKYAQETQGVKLVSE